MSIWEMIQHVRSGKPKAGARRAWGVNAVAVPPSSNGELEERVERLQLMTEAMWELMAERERLTLTDLAHRLRAIDARQGEADTTGWDGVRVPEFRCSSCQAVIPAGIMKCQFCGNERIEARSSFSA